MTVFENVLDAIGQTPIIRLNNVTKGLSAVVIAKLEFMNPSGSVKDRIALSMIEDAERKELLNENSVIIEPTSGNTGIALATVCAVKGYRCIIVMPEHMSEERQKLLKALGAKVVLTPEKEDVVGAVKEAEKLAKRIKNAFIPHQFRNPVNIQTHYEKTACEILEQTNGKIDAFVAGVGTGGTLMGVGRALKERNKDIKIVAVEPWESAVLSSEKPGKHKIQGIGDGFIPELVDLNLIDEVIKVKSSEAIAMAKRLAKEEGILVGISSGANVHAAIEVAKKTGKNKVIVTILPDRAERYFSSELFEKL
jgi:cysteine synthase A